MGTGRREEGEVKLISVIIPTYNRLPFLREAFASVLAQTLSPNELIIVDDGSTDGTWEWLRGLRPEGHSGGGLECLDFTLPPTVSGHEIRALFLRRSRTGPAAARNLGARHATGGWIAFLDSDDLWLENKLETQLNFLKSHPNYKICQTEEIWIRRGVRVNPRRRHRKYSGDIFPHCLSLCIISPSAVMIEREYFWALGGFDETFPVCEDYELWLRAGLKGHVMTLPQKLTVKRGGHEDQLSRRHWGMDRFRVRALEKLLREPALTEKQKILVLRELERKLAILSLGFGRRHPGREDPYRGKWLGLQEAYGIRAREGCP